MKKNGILNKKLMAELTGLGHGDLFMICDAGFPIPKNGDIIDLALVKNVPGFMEAIYSVLNEVIVEEYFLVDMMKTYNAETFRKVNSLLTKQKKNIIDREQFAQKSLDAKFYVRTGEYAPFSNIIFISASCDDIFVEKFNIG